MQEIYMALFQRFMVTLARPEKLPAKFQLMEIRMNFTVKTDVVVLLAALFIAGCASSATPQSGTWNPADSQRSHSKQAQDELDSSISRDE
jgi:hypothetical protein